MPGCGLAWRQPRSREARILHQIAKQVKRSQLCYKFACRFGPPDTLFSLNWRLHICATAGEELRLPDELQAVTASGMAGLGRWCDGGITDRAFVVRKVYRVNDRLPSDPKQSPKWKWQRAGWLLVDRPTGRVSELHLPDFDPFLLDSELVPRLCGLLRALRRRR